MRIAVAAAVSAALLVPLGIFGGTGFAQTSAPAASQYKITICHHTHSKKHPMVTIRISIRAWPAHQRHGDTMGPCPGTAKHGKHASEHEHHSSHESHSSNSDAGKTHGHEQGENPSQSQAQPQNGNAGATNGQSQSQRGQSGDHGQSGEHGHGK